MIQFSIGDLAIVTANLDSGNTPLDRCEHVRRYGRNGHLYQGTREQVEAVLDEIETCPAYSEPGYGGGEGFGGEYSEVAAVRRASDSIRKALGLPLLGWRRKVRRRRRRR